MKQTWWGYRHVDGGVQAKRWFGDPLDLSEAEQSPFVREVVHPFWAEDREEALDTVRSSTKEVLPYEQWLREKADPDCKLCDGGGVFYGNVHICGCVNSKQRKDERHEQ